MLEGVTGALLGRVLLGVDMVLVAVLSGDIGDGDDGLTNKLGLEG